MEALWNQLTLSAKKMVVYIGYYISLAVESNGIWISSTDQAEMPLNECSFVKKIFFT